MTDPALSPRSPDEPMAATRDEAFRGAVWAWLMFMALLMLIVTLYVLRDAVTTSVDPVLNIGALALQVAFVLGWTAIVGGIVALVVMIVGLPISWLLARGLRRTASVGVHLAVFGGFGAAIGLLALTALGFWSGPYLWGTELPWITVSVTTVSVMFGWWRGSRHARREGHRPDPRSPIWG